MKKAQAEEKAWQTALLTTHNKRLQKWRGLRI
jgi:hypothetical protein